jgi:hypothetical protein
MTKFSPVPSPVYSRGRVRGVREGPLLNYADCSNGPLPNPEYWEREPEHNWLS